MLWGHSNIKYEYSARRSADGKEVVENVTKFQIDDHFSSERLIQYIVAMN